MQVKVSADSTVSLADEDNFKGFSIIEETPGAASTALSAIGEPAEDNHYWLSAESVIELSGRAADSEWVESFWAMLKKVEPYGFADMEKKRVKAHVE